MSVYLVGNKPSSALSFLVFVTIFNYFFLCSLDEGISWPKHGTFSRIVFNYFIIVIGSIRLLHGLLRIVIPTQVSWIRYFALTVFYFWIGVLAFNRLVKTKQTYYDGFNGQRILDNEKLCKFHKFSLNYFSAFDELFWSFSHSHSDCSSK